MKANRIPVAIRLANRIAKLEAKINRRVKIGHGNPYMKCYYCGQSVPYIDIDGHFDGCPEPGIIKEIAHYRALQMTTQLESKFS